MGGGVASTGNQLTLWGPTGQINDYAKKEWGGLVRPTPARSARPCTRGHRPQPRRRASPRRTAAAFVSNAPCAAPCAAPPFLPGAQVRSYYKPRFALLFKMARGVLAKHGATWDQRAYSTALLTQVEARPKDAHTIHRSSLGPRTQDEFVRTPIRMRCVVSESVN